MIAALFVILMIGCGGFVMAALSRTKCIQDRRGWWKRAWLVALVSASINFAIAGYLTVRPGSPMHWRDVFLQLIIVVGITLVVAGLGRRLLSRNWIPQKRVIDLVVAVCIMLVIAPIVLYIFHSPTDYDYQYIDLTESMEALEYGQTELTDMHAHSDMPIRYTLERDHYILHAAVDTLAGPLRPTVVFSVEDKALVGANIKGAGIDCSLFINEMASYEYERRGYAAGGVGLVWVGRWSEPVTGNDVAPLDSDQKCAISIFDGNGKKVAKEEIPFKIVTNGFRRVYSSL